MMDFGTNKRMQSTQAWTTFWKEQGPGSRCVQGASPAIREALERHWHSFAETLPSNLSIVDIGCGAGAVARAIIAAKPDVQVTGIDIAEVPAANEEAIKILSNVPMESTPFGNESFGAAVSLFGYEYGDLRVSAKELARILEPGASFSFLIHHSESPIVASSRTRLHWFSAFFENDMKDAFCRGVAEHFDRRVSVIRQKCAGDTLLVELHSTLRPLIFKPAEARLRIWESVNNSLTPELILLSALDAACVSPSEIDVWLKPLEERFEISSPSRLSTGDGTPIAWNITGVKR